MDIGCNAYVTASKIIENLITKMSFHFGVEKRVGSSNVIGQCTVASHSDIQCHWWMNWHHTVTSNVIGGWTDITQRHPCQWWTHWHHTAPSNVIGGCTDITQRHPTDPIHLVSMTLRRNGMIFSATLFLISPQQLLQFKVFDRTSFVIHWIVVIDVYYCNLLCLHLRAL